MSKISFRPHTHNGKNLVGFTLRSLSYQTYYKLQVTTYRNTSTNIVAEIYCRAARSRHRNTNRRQETNPKVTEQFCSCANTARRSYFQQNVQFNSTKLDYSERGDVAIRAKALSYV
ncbi:MAG: hypothetical protein AAGB04_22755 [Pseudomonadota bacterium]